MRNDFTVFSDFFSWLLYTYLSRLCVLLSHRLMFKNRCDDIEVTIGNTASREEISGTSILQCFQKLKPLPWNSHKYRWLYPQYSSVGYILHITQLRSKELYSTISHNMDGIPHWQKSLQARGILIDFRMYGWSYYS